MNRSGDFLRTSFFGLLFGLSGAATAADETPGSEEAISEVVVTATHRAENAKDVPVSISVVDSNLLTSIGNSGDDIKQLAFRVPSLNIESSNGRAFPRFYIRGYGNTDFHDFASQPVGLYYDDIVQENAALKGFPIFDQADVEVLRGPQGTLFGRNSPAGVVKVESAKPQLGVTSGYFSLSDGTFNTAVVEGVVNVPINDVMAFRVSTQIQHRNNWVNDPINQTRNGGYNDLGARAQLLFKPNDSLSVLLNVHGRSLDGSSSLFRGNIIELGSNHLVPGFNPGMLYTDGPNSSTLGTIGANLHISWMLPGVTLQSISGYETVQNYLAEGDIDGGYGPGNVFCNLGPGGCPPTPATGPGHIPFAVQTSAGLVHHEQLTQEFRVLTNYDGPLQAQGGVFLFYENVTSADNDYCTPGSTINNCPNVQLWSYQDSTVSRQRNDAEAVFGSVDYKPVEQFKATAGVRLTRDHKEFATLYTDTVPPPTAPLAASAKANNVSWDVSGTYSVTPDINVYARVATGFRAPSFGPPAAGLPVQVAASEKIISYEGGVKADFWDHKARVSWDAYFYDIKDQQLTAVGGNSNTIKLINAQKTLGKGSELEIELRPINSLTFNLSGSYNETRIEDPTLAVSPCFNWDFAVPGVKCNLQNPTNTAGLALINGNPLPQAAKWVGDLGVRYDYALADSSSLYAYSDISMRSAMNIFLYQAQEFVAPPLTQVGLRLGYTWNNDKYDVAAFCRNCANQIRVIGGIDFADALGFINDPRIFGAQFRARF